MNSENTEPENLEPQNLEDQSLEPQNFEQALKEIENLRRINRQQARDIRLLSVMNENAEKLRRFNVAELIETRERAEEAARSKSSFLANMSHEIRTPMNAVKGFSELLAITKMDDIQRNYVQNIINSANSLISIINDILDFSKIDARKVELIEGTYSLGELISEVSSSISFKGGSKDLAVFFDISPEMPSQLRGDDIRIKQVMVNLLSNAVKYTNKGFVQFTLRSRVQGERADIFCEVSDSGIGIKEEDIAQLFESFTRLDMHTNRSIKGTGLGLAISKQLVQAMGGAVTVRSEYGKGSAFGFSIPQQIVNPEPLAQVHKPGEKYVLLLGDKAQMQHLQMPHIQHMLESLKVPCLLGSHKEIPEIRSSLSACTHCIYDTDYTEADLSPLRERFPHCTFAALRDMQKALDIEDFRDVILFSPLLITDLAKYLNREKPNRESSASMDGLSLDDTAVIPRDFTVRNTRLLIVDDNDINLMVCSEMLKTLGAEVICAESGGEALLIFGQQDFDIVFLDHMMPIMDGIETAAKMRAMMSSLKPSEQTPLVCLTANVVSDMRDFYIQNGMDDFIGKPIEFADLERILYTWLPKEKRGKRR
ncbi:MAG: response regulator [Spirochaetaceae bacterium]|nr:response regulator [Spirochaetaceae bacterium]